MFVGIFADSVLNKFSSCQLGNERPVRAKFMSYRTVESHLQIRLYTYMNPKELAIGKNGFSFQELSETVILEVISHMHISTWIK